MADIKQVGRGAVFGWEEIENGEFSFCYRRINGRGSGGIGGAIPCCGTCGNKTSFEWGRHGQNLSYGLGGAATYFRSGSLVTCGEAVRSSNRIDAADYIPSGTELSGHASTGANEIEIVRVLALRLPTTARAH
jgi:hypothetical protein